MFTARRIGLCVVLTVVCLASIIWIDVPLAHYVAAHATPEVRSAAFFFQKVGESQWVLGYSLLVTLVAWRGARSLARRHAALFTAVAASGIAANIIKVIVCRPRPPMLLNHGITNPQWFGFIVDWQWNSFPSGHATTGIAIALAGSYVWPQLRWLMWGLGLAIVFARIANNAHYASDVVGGVVVGMVVWFITENSLCRDHIRSRHNE